MRNKFPGICYRCGENVAVGAGHFEKMPGHGWRVQHATCAIEFRGCPDDVTLERNAMQRRQRNRTDAIIAQGTGKSAQRARRRLRDLPMQKNIGASE